jgi:hypothetical protein
LSKKDNINQSRMNLAGIPKRDFLLSGICGVLGFFLSFLPYSGPDLNQPNVNSWIRLYGQAGKHLLTWPWGLILMVVFALLLVHSRFRRGGLGVAFCLGVVLGKVIASVL